MRLTGLLLRNDLSFEGVYILDSLPLLLLLWCLDKAVGRPERLADRDRLEGEYGGLPVQEGTYNVIGRIVSAKYVKFNKHIQHRYVSGRFDCITIVKPCNSLAECSPNARMALFSYGTLRLFSDQHINLLSSSTLGLSFPLAAGVLSSTFVMEASKAFVSTPITSHSSWLHIKGARYCSFLVNSCNLCKACVRLVLYSRIAFFLAFAGVLSGNVGSADEMHFIKSGTVPRNDCNITSAGNNGST